MKRKYYLFIFITFEIITGYKTVTYYVRCKELLSFKDNDSKTLFFAEALYSVIMALEFKYQLIAVMT